MSMSLTILLIISFILNVVFIWYIVKLIQELNYMSENTEHTSGVLSEFLEHLERLYELETYYGDESLKSLIRHSKEVLEEVKEFETVISPMKEQEHVEEKEE